MSRTDPLVAGVDGCPAGWIAAVGAIGNSEPWLTFSTTFAGLLALHPRVVRWAVDIPIGLADDGPRQCDTLAREVLGPRRRASVFPSPPRAVADYMSDGGDDYVEACRLAQGATGKKISKQAWNITPKIAEVRDYLLRTPRHRQRVFETHPELCFARLAGGEALPEGKKATAGKQMRRRLLEDHFGADLIDRLLTQTEAISGVGIDDTIDALACWTAAKRAGLGEASSLPTKPPGDATGLPMAIVT